MSKELIEMLRADAESTDDIGLCADAADRIEELERKNKRLFHEHHYQACLTHDLLPYQERAVKAEHQLVATIDILEQTRVERDALQADNARLIVKIAAKDVEIAELMDDAARYHFLRKFLSSKRAKIKKQLAEREKQVKLLREIVRIAIERGDLYISDQEQAEAALAATEEA